MIFNLIASYPFSLLVNGAFFMLHVFWFIYLLESSLINFDMIFFIKFFTVAKSIFVTLIPS